MWGVKLLIIFAVVVVFVILYGHGTRLVSFFTLKSHQHVVYFFGDISKTMFFFKHLHISLKGQLNTINLYLILYNII